MNRCGQLMYELRNHFHGYIFIYVKIDGNVCCRKCKEGIRIGVNRQGQEEIQLLAMSGALVLLRLLIGHLAEPR